MGDFKPESIDRVQLPGYTDEPQPEHRQKTKKVYWGWFFCPETYGAQKPEKNECNNPEPAYLPDVSRVGVHFANLHFLSIQAALL